MGFSQIRVNFLQICATHCPLSPQLQFPAEIKVYISKDIHLETQSTWLRFSIAGSGLTTLTLFFVFFFSQWQTSVGSTFPTTVTIPVATSPTEVSIPMVQQCEMCQEWLPESSERNKLRRTVSHAVPLRLPMDAMAFSTFLTQPMQRHCISTWSVNRLAPSCGLKYKIHLSLQTERPSTPADEEER